MKMLLKVLILYLLLMSLISGLLLWYKYQEDTLGEAEYSNLREQIVGGASISSISSTEAMNRDFADVQLPDIDEQKLKEINPDYVAWLYLADTKINYPIVFPKNNQEYLKLTFEGARRSCGSLFFDAGTEPFSSLNTIIHGHNMKSGRMFGELKQYLREDFAKAHNKLYLFHEGEWERYQLLSVYLIQNSDAESYQTMFLSKEEFDKYVDHSVMKSLLQTERSSDITEILTLSTCHGKKEKLIVQWEKIEASVMR